MRLLWQVFYVYGWYSATVLVAGFLLVLATWLIQSAMRFWKKQ